MLKIGILDDAFPRKVVAPGGHPSRVGLQYFSAFLGTARHDNVEKPGGASPVNYNITGGIIHPVCEIVCMNEV